MHQSSKWHMEVIHGRGQSLYVTNKEKKIVKMATVAVTAMVVRYIPGAAVSWTTSVE